MPAHLEAICNAMVSLLDPFGEVVLHDWVEQKILYIAGRLSHREIGDPSFMDEIALPESTGPVIGPYRKTNPDGRQIKSISILMRDTAGDPKHLLCLNMDVSRFDAAQVALSHFTSVSAENQQNPLARDWLEPLHEFIANWRVKRGLVDGALSVECRQSLIAALMDEGVFDRPKAAEAIARAIGVSRATVYGDLKSLQAR
ncbi:MAG: PAS domain-containing protein [Pseudomonadota bacterium]